MRLTWSQFAVADRLAIYEYVEADNVGAANRLDDQIREGVELLVSTPEMGRPGRVAGTRELVVPGTPYIVAYQVKDEVIRALRVLHGARMWPLHMDRG